MKHSDNESSASWERDLSHFNKSDFDKEKPTEDLFYEKIPVINDKISCLRKRNKRKKSPNLQMTLSIFTSFDAFTTSHDTTLDMSESFSSLIGEVISVLYHFL